MLGRALSAPLVAEEIELAPIPTSAVCPAPVNTAMVPADFTRTYQDVFTEVTPNFRQVVYHVPNVHVAWHGTVLRGLRVFVPSLPQPYFELEAGPVGLAFDSWSGNYFHWIAEVLPRLVLLRKVQPDCVVLLPGPKPPEYVTRTVSALGFTRTHLIGQGELVHVRDLWMPARPGRHGFMVPELTKEVHDAVIDSLRDQLDPSRRATRRLYVSRNRQQWRHLTNEPEVLAVLARYGFETVYFEDMNFVEQVRTMYEASIFIGIHGANMTNLLFMTPGTHALEMLSETYINPSYMCMAAAIGVHYSLVPSKLGSPLNVEHNYADITADPALVDQALRAICGPQD
jgi:Glycosyltransferase 61